MTKTQLTGMKKTDRSNLKSSPKGLILRSRFL